MKHHPRSLRTAVVASTLAAIALASACATEITPPEDSGGIAGTGPAAGSGAGGHAGAAVTGGTGGSTGGSAPAGTGGAVGTGGAMGGTGGSTGGAGGTTGGAGGTTGGAGGTTGGTSGGVGGTVGSGGSSKGGASTGGSGAMGGAAMGGRAAGGRGAGGVSSGGAGTGGTSSMAGSSGTGSSGTSSTLDCANVPAMPTGGQTHTSGQGGSDNLAWQIWSNAGSGQLTTFTGVPAFSASWNNSGNYLGRLGFEWGNKPQKFDAFGTISADFAESLTGNSGNQWSYVGMYGWSTNPCIEWYIIDDSFGKMPVNPGNCTNMSNSPLSVDGGQYTMCVRSTSGTGGDRCGGAAQWNQYYSIRHDNRKCGTISVTEHFKAWAAAGNDLGTLLEVKVLLEVGGGQGTANFAVANVSKTM